MLLTGEVINPLWCKMKHVICFSNYNLVGTLSFENATGVLLDFEADSGPCSLPALRT